MTSPSTRADTADREITISRVFNAPRELVFRAWTEPQHLAQWWGPKNFTNTFHQFDPRPGGDWRFIMHGPNGTDYPNYSVYARARAAAAHRVRPPLGAGIPPRRLVQRA